MVDTLNKQINLLAPGTASAIHNYDKESDNLAAALITIEGYGITDFNITYESNNSTAEADVVGVEKNTGIGRLTRLVPNLVSDLKYNADYTPDYAIDGPLYTLKDLGYTAQVMITGSTKMSDGSIAWDNIDLTKTPDTWLKNQDFNLFSIDGESGYWVYLIDDTVGNKLTVPKITLRPNFVHHFNSDDGSTVNIVRATLSATVEGLPKNKVSASVFASISGNKIELASGSNNGIYVGSISSYEVENMVTGRIYDVLINVSDGLGYSRMGEDKISLDFKKPKKPTIVKNNGANVKFASTSTDVSGYYVYKDNVPEKDTATNLNKVAKIVVGDADSYNLCASSGLDYGTEYNLRLFAMDGLKVNTGASSDGELGYGNASDVLSFTFTPVLKGAVLLENTNGVDAQATALGKIFNNNCESTADATTNSGVSVKSVISDKVVRLSYIPIKGINFDTDIPKTIFVGESVGVAGAQIKYLRDYANKTFFVQMGDKVYKGTFPRDDTANKSSDKPLDLSGGIVEDQSLATE
jgi:hypothetical protein